LGASSFDSVAFAEKRADGREQANAGVIEREDRAIWAARMVAFRCKEATIMVAFFAAQLCACSRCLCGGRVAVVVFTYYLELSMPGLQQTNPFRLSCGM
jgi:hypothetical protein